MKYAIAQIAAFLSCGVLYANEVTTASAAEAPITDTKPFVLTFDETVGFYSFDNDIVSSNTEIGLGLTDWLTVSADLAVFNDGDETDFGDLTFVADAQIVNGKGGFFNTDKTTLNAFFGVGVPLDGFFSSDSAIYTIGGKAGFGWGSWSLDLDGSYNLVDGATFVPTLGGFIDSDYVGVSGTVSHSGLIDGLTLGVKVSETWSDNDGDILTVGPVAAWSITNSLSLSGEVGFTVLDNDLTNGSSDLYGSVGLQFSF